MGDSGGGVDIDLYADVEDFPTTGDDMVRIVMLMKMERNKLWHTKTGKYLCKKDLT